MTEKQRAAIEQHGRNLLAIFPDATERDPVALCKKLRRLETRLHRVAEKWCKGEATSDDWDDAREAVAIRLHNILGWRGAGERLRFNADPRGYALKVDLADGERLYTDWGGYGIIAPEIGPEGN